MRTTAISRERVFTSPFMASVAYVASAIPRLVSLEVVEALRPALGQRSNVSVMRIKAVVNMAVKAVTAVKPGASSKKHPANKPVGPIIAVRSTVIRGVVEIPIRTHGSHSDVYTDGNLGWRHGHTTQKASHESCESKRTDFEHDSSLLSFDSYRGSTWTTQRQHNTNHQYRQVGPQKVIATGSQLGNCRSDCC
jgi:hypothetical protein